jgi:hypothetical protein
MAKPENHKLELISSNEMEIEAQDALEANAVWYYTRTMCQIALPASSYTEREYVRESGAFHLIVQALPPLHVPWGIYPRGILNWAITEIVRKKNMADRSRTLELGASLAEFMERVSGTRAYSGGQFGNIKPFKRQLSCLFGSRVAFWIGNGLDMTEGQGASMQIGAAWNLMWHTKLIEQPGLFQSTIQIGEEFYEDCIQYAVPVDVRVVRGLWPDCLAFDIYVWLTYRSHTMLRARRWSLDLSWYSLKMQFGQQYKELYQFRWKFLRALRRVNLLYTGFEFSEREGRGMTFKFKRPSILALPAAPPPPRNPPVHYTATLDPIPDPRRRRRN